MGLLAIGALAQNVEKLDKLPLDQLRNMAKGGNMHAQNELGLAYVFGTKTGQTNLVLAREWFERAAEQGLPAAQCNLASLYLGGRGVPQDFDKAIDWYRKAAEQGFVQAQFALGWIYGTGRTGELNYKEAVKWYSMAAQGGDREAQMHLGLLHLKGENLAPDYVQAYKWLNLAAAQGQTNAIRIRNQLNLALSANELRQAQQLSSQVVSAR